MDAFVAFVNAINGLLHTPAFWIILGLLLLYWCFAAAVGSMEMPTAESTARYRFWFKFLNRLAANLERARVALHIPGEDLKGS